MKRLIKNLIKTTIGQSYMFKLCMGNNKQTLLILGISSFLLSGCKDQQSTISQDPVPDSVTIPIMKSLPLNNQQITINLERLSKELKVVYNVVDNLKAKGCELGYDHSGKIYSKESNYFTHQNQIKRNKDWAEFTNALVQKELTKLDIDGVFYRLPTVGAQLENGQLKMNSIFQGLPMEYQIGDGVWISYSADEKNLVKDSQKSVRVRVTNPTGNRVGRSLLLVH